MLEALWSVEFVTPQGAEGAGVAIFETGRIFGGDSNYYYVGKFDLDGDVAHGIVEVTHYNGPPNTVFGPANRIQVVVSGQVQVPIMDLHGHLVGNPNQKIIIRCTKRAELP